MSEPKLGQTKKSAVESYLRAKREKVSSPTRKSQGLMPSGSNGRSAKRKR